VRQGGIRFIDGLVLADDAAQLLAQRAGARFERRQVFDRLMALLEAA